MSEIKLLLLLLLLDQLNKLNPSKAQGPDGIPPWFLNSHTAYRGISRDDIHCQPALTTARAAMHRLVRQC